ncbi:hypothetical protein DPM13_16405 [Paracoccus mutanolyticus]|uniref:Uncharacterized protein n=1 Tax=Paracoccus mutanolyticus TaxID=1499308 RepID=A0ABM6WTI9_9RHOB|nr:hypothetical protein DPM13_16405 [Paracoccus mutanolyticus]
MAKAVFHRRFDATDTKKGVSIRVEPLDTPQTFPEWVIAKAEAAGAATRMPRASCSLKAGVAPAKR